FNHLRLLFSSVSFVSILFSSCPLFLNHLHHFHYFSILFLSFSLASVLFPSLSLFSPSSSSLSLVFCSIFIIFIVFYIIFIIFISSFYYRKKTLSVNMQVPAARTLGLGLGTSHLEGTR
ncbi:MAG: hypothetical protein ACKPKO_43795, partial [Candidatus Fonsibacter sp.]